MSKFNSSYSNVELKLSVYDRVETEIKIVETEIKTVETEIKTLKNSFSWSWLKYERLILIFCTIMIWVGITVYLIYLSQKFSDQLSGVNESVFNIRKDSNDSQLREFQENLPLLILVAIIFILGSLVIKKNVQNFELKKKILLIYYVIFGFIFVFVLYAASIINWLILTFFNYVITKYFSKYKYFYIFQLIWAIFVLTILFYFGDYKFSSISNDLAFLDKLKPLYGWYYTFNMTLIRTTSFSIDFNWARTKRINLDLKHQQYCRICNENTKCYKSRQESNLLIQDYNLLNYYSYLFYPPLYIAGPMISFNAFISQINDGGQNVYSNKEVLKYLIRTIVDFIFLQLFLHFLYANSFITNKSNRFLLESLNIFAILMFGFMELMFLWLKFLSIWRLFRVWALIEGIDSIENMNRCVLNNYTFEGFWRSWHRSFNQWLIRYIFIPFGGSNYKLINIWLVFTFVALWHDFKLDLVLWAWSICLFLMIEMMFRKYFTQKKFDFLWKKIYWKYMCALFGGLNACLMSFSNIIGFGFGYDGLLNISSKFSDFFGIISILSLIIIFSLTVLVMFIIRDKESENNEVKGY